jgi:hypothetical protein
VLKSAAENNVPDDAPFVSLFTKNAPPTVALALIANEAGVAALVTTEGFADVADENEAVGRDTLL